MIMKSFRAATPCIFAAYFDLCLPERIYLAGYCGAFPSPATTVLPAWGLLKHASSNLSQVSCAQTRMRIDGRIESPGASLPPVIEMVRRPMAAPVKCDLDRVCIDQARTAASGLPFVRPHLWNSICMTSERCLKTVAPMHKVSKVWETHITPKKKLALDQFWKANDRELFRWSVQRRLSALSPVQTIAFLPRFIPGQRKSSRYF